MRRVAEIIYIVPEKREQFLEGALHPDEEATKVLWMCGIRKQQYFALNDLIFMTFEYEGHDFDYDMKKMAMYLDSKGLLVKTRRKDVPINERESRDWWAPVKRLGTLLTESPFISEANDNNLMEYLDGVMNTENTYNDISYDEDDWSEGFQF